MALEKNTMAARYDDENVQFVEWLAKQADNGYGVTRSQILNRGWSFIRALYSLSEDAVSFHCVQRLQSLSGLPLRSAVNGAGLASDRDGHLDKQARLNFKRSLLNRLVEMERESYSPSFPARIRFSFDRNFNTRRSA